jgi:hypothetical protein
MEKKKRTKGGVILEDIKIGDIHYEYEHGMCVKSRVIEGIMQTENDEDSSSTWEWKAVHILPDGSDGRVIDYAVNDKYTHYGPNLYDYQAYTGCTFI